MERLDWRGLESQRLYQIGSSLDQLKDAAIYLTCVPLSLEEVKELAERWECDILSDRIPVTVLHTGSGQNIKRTSITAKIMVLETPGINCGMGVFPLIEQV